MTQHLPRKDRTELCPDPCGGLGRGCGTGPGLAFTSRFHSQVGGRGESSGRPPGWESPERNSKWKSSESILGVGRTLKEEQATQWGRGGGVEGGRKKGSSSRPRADCLSSSGKAVPGLTGPFVPLHNLLKPFRGSSNNCLYQHDTWLPIPTLC